MRRLGLGASVTQLVSGGYVVGGRKTTPSSTRERQGPPSLDSASELALGTVKRGALGGRTLRTKAFTFTHVQVLTKTKMGPSASVRVTESSCSKCRMFFPSMGPLGSHGESP